MFYHVTWTRCGHVTQAEPIRSSLHTIWNFDRANQFQSMACKFMSCGATTAPVL